MELTPDLRRREHHAPADPRAAEWAVWHAPGPNGKRLRAAAQGLFATQSERLAEPSGGDAALVRNLPVLLGASLAAHLCLLLALVLSPQRPVAEPSTETPVEVVVEQPPAGGGPEQQKSGSGIPPEQKAAEQKAAEQKAAEQKAAEQKTVEQKAAEQKTAEQKTVEQKAVEQKAAEQKAAQQEQNSAEQKATEQKAAEQKAAQQKAAEKIAAERKPPTADPATSKAAERATAPAKQGTQARAASGKPVDKFDQDFAGGADSQFGSQGGLRLPFDNGPEIFKSVAMPPLAEDGDVAMSYKQIVFDLLRRVQHYPESARERGAHGAAVIAFTIDDAGELTNVSLLRSSGDSDLDVESLALAARAAPFPKPPPGAQRSIAAEITFGVEVEEDDK
jgi:TonB family protein